jgi:PAT family beta-lactamase induction signal transducer AmpG
MRFLSTFLNTRLISIFFLGFASGLPLALTGSTLQAWYTVSGIPILTIGLLSLVGQPYLFKFLWSPLMDRYVPWFLGRRRGWILLTQISLLFTIAGMAFCNPSQHPYLLAILALMVAFLSASQDISIDAYRTDILTPHEYGFGAALAVGGYRVGMLISGGIALIMAQICGWQCTYLIMAFCMLLGIVTTFLAPPLEYTIEPSTNLRNTIVESCKEFLSRKYALGILLFIFLYKLSFEFSFVFTPTFLLREVGFSLIDIGMITKGFGLCATLIGIFMGGIILIRMSLFTALFSFGILQASANLLYMLLAMIGKDYILLMNAIFFDNLFGGMLSAAIVAFIMSLCNHRFTATQFAIFSAFATLPRITAGPIAAYFVQYNGWVSFYLFSFLIAIPGLLLLWFMRDKLNRSEHAQTMNTDKLVNI